MSALELKIPPVVLLLLTAVAMWFVSAAMPSFDLQVPYRQALASLLALAGVTVAVLGLVQFRRSRTTVNPTRPQDTSSLVTTGVYRFSRNPMYLGFLLVLLAWAVLLANAFAVLPVTAFVAYMNRLQIAPEERALAAAFGTQFSAYRRRVRRWA